MQTDVEKVDIRFPEPPENLRGHRCGYRRQGAYSMRRFPVSPGVAVGKVRTGQDTARALATFAVPAAAAIGGGTSTTCGECAPLPE